MEDHNHPGHLPQRLWNILVSERPTEDGYLDLETQNIIYTPKKTKPIHIPEEQIIKIPQIKKQELNFFAAHFLQEHRPDLLSTFPEKKFSDIFQNLSENEQETWRIEQRRFVIYQWNHWLHSHGFNENLSVKSHKHKKFNLKPETHEPHLPECVEAIRPNSHDFTQLVVRTSTVLHKSQKKEETFPTFKGIPINELKETIHQAHRSYV